MNFHHYVVQNFQHWLYYMNYIHQQQINLHIIVIHVDNNVKFVIIVQYVKILIYVKNVIILNQNMNIKWNVEYHQ